METTERKIGKITRHTSIKKLGEWLKEYGGGMYCVCGKEAFREMKERYPDTEETKEILNGPFGFFVEIALNQSCAGNAFSTNYYSAIQNAFNTMIRFAKESEFFDLEGNPTEKLLEHKKLFEEIKG